MGIEGLGNVLDSLTGWKDADVLSEAIEAGAGVIESGAKSRCKSSSVREVISTRPVNSKREGYVAFTTNARHERAAIEEFGSGPREGQRGPHNFPARPFLRSTADEDKPQIDSKVKEILGSKFDTKLRQRR